MSKPLTVANIRRAKPGDVLRDAEVHGLHLRVFPTTAVYYLHYRSPTERKPSGKPVERRRKLGPASALSLPEIRALARSCVAQVAAGQDPSLTKRLRAAEPTIDDLFKLVLAGYWSAARFIRSGWKRQVETVYEHDIKPTFGGRRASDPLNDVEDWHAAFKTRKRKGNLALAILSRMLNLAESNKYGRLRPLNSNPCSTVTRHPEGKRGRFASHTEITKVGALLEKYAGMYPAAVAFMYILIFSGSRPRAIERATWDQLTEIYTGGQLWGILKFQGKTGAEVVYLPPQAMAVIRKLPRVTGGTITGMGLPVKMWRRIRREAGCPDLWMRDWRRTFATVGLSSGEAMSRISELLNHKSTQTTKRYALLADDAKRAVAGNIAASLDGLLRAKSS